MRQQQCPTPHIFDCPTWHKEKEILKIKYTRHFSFEARKIVEQQSSTASRNYGTQVRLVDAMTQTNETYDVQIKTHQNPGGDAPSGTNQTAGGKAAPAQNPPSNKSAGGKPLTGGKPPTAGGKPRNLYC